jgi:hypothetical protein
MAQVEEPPAAGGEEQSGCVLLTGCLAVLVVVGLFAWEFSIGPMMRLEQWWSFERMPASVKAVDTYCLLFWDRMQGRSPVESSHNRMPCPQARAAAAIDEPSVRKRALPMVQLTYEYTSPADGALHTGSFEVAVEVYPNIKPGDRIEVMAHREEADRSERPLW